MALGRHLGRGKYLSGLAGFPIEDLAVTEAFALFDRLDRDACRALAARLDALPPFPDLASAVRAERAYFRANYRDRFAVLSGSDVEGPIRAEFGLNTAMEEDRALADRVFPAGDPAERILRASGGSKEGLIALADEVLAALETLAAVAGGAADAAEKLAALRATGASNPLLADELNSFDRMRPIWERSASRCGRLRAVVLAGGPGGRTERIPRPD
jgi:hypothetical protein